MDLKGVHAELELSLHLVHELELDILALVVAERDERPARDLGVRCCSRSRWCGRCGYGGFTGSSGRGRDYGGGFRGCRIGLVDFGHFFHVGVL